MANYIFFFKNITQLTDLDFSALGRGGVEAAAAKRLLAKASWLSATKRILKLTIVRWYINYPEYQFKYIPLHYYNFFWSNTNLQFVRIAVLLDPECSPSVPWSTVITLTQASCTWTTARPNMYLRAPEKASEEKSLPAFAPFIVISPHFFPKFVKSVYKDPRTRTWSDVPSPMGPALTGYQNSWNILRFEILCIHNISPINP